jgi:hypothetical protein
MKTQKPYPVSEQLAARITAMVDDLKREFGCDFAFVIFGAGQIISARNLKHGIISPVTDSR